ncbi:MAG: FAD-dependent oxidoreductase [Bacillota bacterium]|nr:FAD-dependent oxidoreductase [Bacillota bacterium]
MSSIWEISTNLPEQKSLTKDIEADVAVIGGGLAGLLTAYKLKKRGINAVVLEAEKVACGQTKNTTAKITSQHGLIYKSIIDNVSLKDAIQYARANQDAIKCYKEIIEENNIDCEFEEKNAYLYASVDEAPLKKELEAAKECGIEAYLTRDTGLPFKVLNALCYPNQAQFNPLKFILGILPELDVYEHTMVTDIEEDKVITKNGMVTAKWIVVATHYPFINTPGYYFMRMHQERSYAIALEKAADVNGMYIGIDGQMLSFRNYQNYLILGGGGHRAGENSAGGQYDLLKNEAIKYYPDSKVMTQWSAQDCMTLDSIPYIGRYSDQTPNMLVATGFKKWGMTTSMVSANILSDMITEKENKYAEVFSPDRFNFSASAKSLMDEGLHATKGLAKSIFSIPDTIAADLPNSHGGVVKYEGEKVGVYKDENGKIFIIEPKCSHLGCLLSWNPDEKSWDCPCHGSRFDYKGNLIDNPAMKDLNG